MSFSQSMYIGHYISFVEYETVNTDYEETRCINEDCPNHNKEMEEGVKFCPECGSKVDWQDVMDTKTKCVNEYLYECEDTEAFYVPEFIDLCLVNRYEELDYKPHTKFILVNRHSIPYTGSHEEFVNHPAVKELIGKLGKCDIHFGLVQYQS